MRYDFWVVPCCFMIVSVHFSALAIEQSDSSLPKLKNQGKWKQRFTSKTMWNCLDGGLWTRKCPYFVRGLLRPSKATYRFKKQPLDY